MAPFDPPSVLALALAAALMMLLTVLSARRRRDAPRGARQGSPDTTAPRFLPQAVRVLAAAERQAFCALREAMPSCLILAQVPLTRFLRVESGQARWLQQVSGMSADLLVCDSGSRVLLAISVRSPAASEASRRRHDRMSRLLKAAGIKVLSWNEEALPDVASIRAQLVPLLAPATSQSPLHRSTPAGTMSSKPLIPVADVLANYDDDSGDRSMEPVASALFDEFEPDLPLPSKR